MRSRLSFASALAIVVGLAACGGDDDGAAPIDARRTDAATDAGDPDASDPDAAVDAAADAAVDASPDAMATPSELIGYVRAAADGTGLSLPIMSATVTYLKPALGNPTNDPAGFTIQVAQTGPGLFVAVDPATLTPAPVVGDVVSFTVTAVTTVGGQKRATAIGNFTRESQGADVGALAQDVNAAADLVSAVDTYDSELVDVTATIAGDFIGAGNSFESAPIDTAGLAGDANLRLRLPTTVRSSLALGPGCAFTLDNVPVARFTSAQQVTQAQLPAFHAADITVTSCPAPTVAEAISLTPTSVRLTFSRDIQASSVMADGSQFTFDNGLTASAATVSGRTITVTTSAQTSGTTYTVTVADTVTDLRGTGVGTPNSGTFTAVVPAVVRINEVNANIETANNQNVCDLIELRVVSGGSMDGYYLRERNSGMLVAFNGLNVQTNDIIVVHMNTTNTMCNPSGATSETTGPAEQPVSMHARNYDSAYDWYSTDTGLTSTDNVFTLYNAANVIIDAVFIDDDMPGSNVASATETQAATVAAANQWQMVGGGVPAGGFVDDNFRLHAALDSDATGTTVTGESIRRVDDTDDNDKDDWAQGAQSWGVLNPGQTPF